MRLGTMALVLTAAAALSGCNAPISGTTTHHGRYLGVGIYAAGEAWSRMTVPAPAGKPSAARTADDEHIIVVVDSNSGEIRQCGDMSGYCTGINPWSKALSSTQQSPVDLTKRPTSPPPPATAEVNLKVEPAQ